MYNDYMQNIKLIISKCGLFMIFFFDDVNLKIKYNELTIITIYSFFLN